MPLNEEKNGVFTIALLGYSRKYFQYIAGLVNMVELDRPIKLLAGDLAKTREFNCGLAVAILDNAERLDEYIRGVALVKQCKFKPAVVCAIQEADEEKVEARKNEITADDILYMPIMLEQFTKIVRTAAEKETPHPSPAANDDDSDVIDIIEDTGLEELSMDDMDMGGKSAPPQTPAEPILESNRITITEPILESNKITITEPILESNKITIAEPVLESNKITIAEPILESNKITIAEPVLKSNKIAITELPILESSKITITDNKKSEDAGPVVFNTAPKAAVSAGKSEIFLESNQVSAADFQGNRQAAESADAVNETKIITLANKEIPKQAEAVTIAIDNKIDGAAKPPPSANPDQTEINAMAPIRIGDLLIRDKLITEKDLSEALRYQKKAGMRVGDALIELGLITEEQKLNCLARQLKTTVADAHRYSKIDIDVAALIPEHIARRFSCLAIEKQGEELIVVTNDVLDLKMLDMLRDVTDMRITAILGKKEDISTSIERCYRDITTHQDATQIAESMAEDQVEFLKNKEDEDLDGAAAGNELGIIKLVNVLITNAIRDRASDIHIEPMENEVIVRYRIDGDMRRVMSPPKRSHHAIIARIKILSELNIAERRLPQDGRMAIKLPNKREVDVRVSILPTIFGEKAVLRILDKEAFDKSTTNLGLSSADEEIFRAQISKPYGIVIVTGPTGSGKSTTLYSALQTVKSVTKNIITVEDPVEFHMEGINQVNVNTKIGMTFGAALRSILRQDPDIVLIGEIRDNETADIAIKMALTGHLVFSTLHTNDAASSIARFTDIGVPPLLLGSSLNLIIAQRLVRRICTKCKTEYTPESELLETLGLNPANVPQLYKGVGCVTCNGTGFAGRVALFEMLQVSRDIRKLILRSASTMDIQEQAAREGMRSLRHAGIELALNGTTTIEQIIAATMEV